MRRKPVAVIVGALALAGSSLAATTVHPKAGRKYTGFTSEKKVNGFGAPVSFKVSRKGTSLLSFTYSTLGCFGSGGIPAGVDPFAQPSTIHKLGSIKVSSKGTFSAKNVVTGFASFGQRTFTTSTVTGKFKNPKTAIGTIKFTQSFRSQVGMGHCGPAKRTFTATTK